MSDKANSQSRVRYDDTEIAGFDLGGTEILYYQGIPFTGIVETREADGMISVEREYQNGYLHGLQREFFHPGGSIEFEYTIIDNSFEGAFRTYDEKGNLINENHWLKGKRVE
jgi:antitoxin component YwqK of YwqJK toxin-antitoxin module